jgi:hypothetical protein
MLERVVEVRHVGGHKLWLRFNDGESGEVDLSNWLQFDGVFEPHRDEAFFAKVRVDMGTIAWPNDTDLDPLVLYSLVTGKPLPSF